MSTAEAVKTDEHVHLYIKDEFGHEGCIECSRLMIADGLHQLAGGRISVKEFEHGLDPFSYTVFKALKRSVIGKERMVLSY